MTRRAMRDHRQADVWPKRPSPALDRIGRVWDKIVEDEEALIALRDKSDAVVDAIHLEIAGFLGSLNDQELAELDPHDHRVNATIRIYPRAVMFGVICYDEIAIMGEFVIADEQDRRAALTGHQRIAETRERMRRKAVAQ